MPECLSVRVKCKSILEIVPAHKPGTIKSSHQQSTTQGQFWENWSEDSPQHK